MNETLLIVQSRFAAHMQRHPFLDWAVVLKLFDQNTSALKALEWMEETKGEPDIFQLSKTDPILLTDFSDKSPIGRVNCCYDEEARIKRKKFPPLTSATELAAKMGVRLMTEEEYLQVQQVAILDSATSSWLYTPPAVRKLGGALTGDYRYGRVFIYHSGADAYYGVRGFRAVLEL